MCRSLTSSSAHPLVLVQPSHGFVHSWNTQNTPCLLSPDTILLPMAFDQVAGVQNGTRPVDWKQSYKSPWIPNQFGTWWPFKPVGMGWDRVCFFPIGFLLVPCKVPFENAILLGYAWEEKRMFCLLAPRPAGKGGGLHFTVTFTLSPTKAF